MRPQGTPYRLRQMAGDFAIAASNIRARAGELDQAGVATPGNWGWSGRAASAYSHTWQGWKTASEAVADRMDSARPGARQILNQLADDLETAQREYDDAVATASTLGLGVDARGYVTPRSVAAPAPLAAGSPEAQIEQLVADAVWLGQQALEWARNKFHEIFDDGWVEAAGRLNDIITPPTIPITVVESATTIKAGVSYIQSARNLPGLTARLFSEEVGPAFSAYDNGESTMADLLVSVRLGLNRIEWARAFTVQADQAAFLRGGLPATRFFDTVGWVLIPVAVATDVMTIINPGPGGAVEQNLNRGAAVVNIVGTGGVVAGLLAADAVAGWIPVAGQVLVVTSGLIMLGIYAYDNYPPFRDFCNTAGSDIAHVAQGAWNTAASDVSTITHTADNVSHAVQNEVSNIQNTVGGAAKTLTNFFHWP